MPTIASTYSELREKFMVQAVNTENNREMLAAVPHIEFGDISMICRIILDRTDDGVKCATVSDSFIGALGITKEKLFTDALRNSQLRFPASLRTMNEVIAELVGCSVEDLPGESPLYVATCNDGNFGAGCIFYSDFLEKVSEKVGDFYVLPSSVHEVLILPDNSEMSADDMREMVMDVNRHELSAKEKLSDSVFYYDSGNRQLEHCSL